jgi:hypothetical protein
MSNVLIRYLLLCFVCISCTDQPAFELDAKSIFRTLPGKIGVTIRSSSGSWYLLIDRGSLSQVSSLTAAPKEAQSSSVEAIRGAPSLTEPHGYMYMGPYLISPDNRFIVASIQRKAALAPLPTAFVIADWRTKNVIAQVKLAEGNFLQGFAWSPDSRRIAVIESWARFKWWLPTQIMSFIKGHPVAYHNSFLDVVDLQGSIVAQMRLTRDLMGASAEVIWTQ